jgi:hypothetical protein
MQSLGPRETGDAGARDCIWGASPRRCGTAFRLSLEGMPESVVRKGGLEPPPLAGPDPKSGASASSATFARGYYKRTGPSRKTPCPRVRLTRRGDRQGQLLTFIRARHYVPKCQAALLTVWSRVLYFDFEVSGADSFPGPSVRYHSTAKLAIRSISLFRILPNFTSVRSRGARDLQEGAGN